MKKIPCLLLSLTGLLLMPGCLTRDARDNNHTVYMGGFHRAGEQGRANFDDVSYWDGDNVSGSPSVKISLGEQRAYFYKGNELVGVSIISTGREGHNTPTGSYRIQQKDADHYELIAKVPTAASAGTSIWVPQFNRYYVAAPAGDKEEAAILVFEPQP